MKKLLTCFAFLATTFILEGCGPSVTENSTEKVTPDSTTVVETSNDSIVEENAILPSPLQIAFIFKKSGLAFNDKLLLEPSKSSNFQSRASKALNLGTYSADLSYCVLNKQNQRSIEYFKTVKQMTEALGIQGIFEKNNFTKRIEKNMSNEDSLAYIISDIQMVMDEYMEENHMKDLTTVIFAGAWVETIYLASLTSTDKTEKLSSRLSEQMFVLRSLNKNLKKIPASSFEGNDLNSVVQALVSIESNYNNLEEVKNYSEESEQSLVLSDKSIGDLSKQIQAVRGKIIK